MKNFAIIDEVDVDFGNHLNILTGETGAGKSILIDSIGIALGQRVSSEIIGNHGDEAMVEVVFQIDDKETLEQIKELDISPDEGQIVISRKITEGRNINKINGESVSVSVIKKVAQKCIDIHGQHEHQSLLSKDRHRTILDEYAKKDCSFLLESIEKEYKLFCEKKKEVEENELSIEDRKRELDFLTYEKEEIENARLSKEDFDELKTRVKKAANASTIVVALRDVYSMISENATNTVSHSLKRLNEVGNLDENMNGYIEQLMDIENLLGDFNHDVSRYMDDFSFDESELYEMEKRLDLVHSLEAKYGDGYDAIMEHYEQTLDKLSRYSDFENYYNSLVSELSKIKESLMEKCLKLSECRKKAAKELKTKITEALLDLNFSYIDFDISLERKQEPSANGIDDIEFLISTNMGETIKPLKDVASGGELSRIMLAIKAVLADTDKIETLIFDEIDAGISGRTAQKVSEKMSVIGKNHQILCITHLPQIAAMADTHFVIEKMQNNGSTITNIRPLHTDEMEKELARLVGGVEVSKAAIDNAREMKSMADNLKTYK